MRFLNNDPKNKKPQDNKPQNGDDGRQGRRIIFLMVAALIATLLINSLYTTIANAYLSEITYNEFQTYLDKDEIAELEFQSDRMVILTRDEAKKPSSQQRLYYTGYIPNVSNDELKDRLDAQGVEYNTEIVEQASPIVTFVVTWLLPVIIMYALFSLLMRGMTKRMGGGIYIAGSGASLDMNNVTVKNCTSYKTGMPGNGGGAVWVKNGSLTAENCVFENNKVNTEGYGGAVMVSNSASASLTTP